MVRLFLVLCLLTTSRGALSEWQPLPPMPQAVQEIYPTVHQGHIYVAGGLSDDLPSEQQQMTALVQIYDPQTRRWRFGTPLPEARHHAYLVSVADKLFLFGGFVQRNGGRWSASSDILMLDQKNDRWQKIANLPKPLTETTAAIIGGKVHLASGRSPQGTNNAEWQHQQDVNWHWVFDPQQLQLVEAPPLEIAFNSAAAVALNEQLYIVGGRQVNKDNLAFLHRYDATTQEWQRLADLPQAQGGLAAAVLDGQIWVFGGEYFSDDGGVYPEIWVYDPTKNLWQQQGTMPLPRHGLGAVSLNDTIYVMGGATRVGLNATTAAVEQVK